MDKQAKNQVWKYSILGYKNAVKWQKILQIQNIQSLISHNLIKH